MPLIAKVEGRPTGNITALYGSKKSLALEQAKGKLQHNSSRGLIHSKGAHTSAAPTPIGPRARLY
jgi:hypothetical protein